jgi:hypothetical protein
MKTIKQIYEYLIYETPQPIAALIVLNAVLIFFYFLVMLVNFLSAVMTPQLFGLFGLFGILYCLAYLFVHNARNMRK